MSSWLQLSKMNRKAIKPPLKLPPPRVVRPKVKEVKRSKGGTPQTPLGGIIYKTPQERSGL